MKCKDTNIKIPVKTIERILLYRNIIKKLEEQGIQYIKSSELSEYSKINRAQIRRDIMALSYQGHSYYGYYIKELLSVMNNTLKLNKSIKTAIIGVGKLGTAIMSYFNAHNTRFDLSIAFDIDTYKIGKFFNNCKIYSINEIRQIIEEEKITFIILTVPDKAAQYIADILSESGIHGILNFTSVPIKVSQNIIVNKVDIMLEMEKLVFYSH